MPVLFTMGYGSRSLRTPSCRAQRALVRQKLPSPSQRVVRRWTSLIARSSRGRWRQERVAGGTDAPNCLGGVGSITGVFLAGALGKSPHRIVLPPFLSQSLGGASLLLCWGCSSVGPLLRDCSGRSGSGNLLQSGFCRQMQGFWFFSSP